MERIHDIYRPKDERRHDWREVERDFTDIELKEQTSRCMNCGQPFCHAYGCPVPDGPKITISLSPRADWRMPSDLP